MPVEEKQGRVTLCEELVHQAAWKRDPSHALPSPRDMKPTFQELGPLPMRSMVFQI